MSDELTEVPSMWYIITVGGCHCPYTAEGEGESPKRTWGKGSRPDPQPLRSYLQILHGNQRGLGSSR